MNGLAAAIAAAARRLAAAAPPLARPAVACVLADGRTLATSDPDRAGSLGSAARAVLDFFAGDWRAGDAAASNDPFQGGIHVCEFTLVRPIALANAAGATLGAAAVAVRMRLPDVGGFYLGGLAPAAFDTWGEGARFTPLKVALAGMPRREALDLIALNSRTPRLLLRLLAAMAAEAETLATTAGPGADPAILETGAAAARAALARLRPGSYSSEATVAAPAGLPQPTVRLEATVTAGGLHLDFARSDAQNESPLNSTPAHTLDCCLGALAAAVAGWPPNGGALAAVSLDPGAGTVTGALPPAITGLSPHLTARAIRRVVGAVLAAAGAPVSDPDVWWQREGAQAYRAHVDPATLRINPEWGAALAALEQAEGGQAG